MDIRKIAILVSRLDEESAETLLGDLSEEQREGIRQAVNSLTDVSVDEVQDVAAELLLTSATAEGADEMFPEEVLSLSPIPTGDAARCLRVSNNEARDVLSAVLRKTSGQALHRILRDEYPQTLAVIVSRMPPDEAAKFLAELTETQRADVMRRIADMDSTDKDVVEDVCAELSRLVDTELSEIDGSLAGRDAVKAILFAAQGKHRSQLIASLSAGDPRLAVQLGVTAEAAAAPYAKKLNGRSPDQNWSFDRILSLDAQQLARVIRSADTEIVLLALIGASPDQIDHVLSGLHASEGSSIRRRLSAIGPVRLRDIEYAQLELVQVAQRMHRDGSESGASRSRAYIVRLILFLVKASLRIAMSETNLPEVQANQRQPNEDADPTDPMGEVVVVDEDSEVDEPQQFALQELVVGHHSREPSGDSAAWCSSSSRLRIEFSRLQVADKDLDTWCHGKLIAFDDASDAPICIYVDETLLARGELVTQNETFGVRITELLENVAQEAA